MKMEHNDSFEYTYSAPDLEEVRRIRAKYVPREENKLERLRRLDASVTQKGTMMSLILGIVSTLVMGIGMCCCMVWTELFVLGIIVGSLGILGIAMAYPVYSLVTARERARIAPEILRLTEELERGG